MIIHITIPYGILIERQDEIIGRGGNPEIYFNSASLDTCRDGDVIHLGDALKKAGLSYTFHAPFMDLAPGGVDSMIRRATQDRLDHILHLAGLIRPKAIVFHPEYDHWRHGEAFDLWLKGSLDMWTPLVKVAEKHGVRLALENVFEHGPEILQILLEKINSSFIGFCFDTGHSLAFSRSDWKEWMDVLGSRLIEVHLHDNNGLEDQHLSPGDGKFDFTGFLNYVWQKRLLPIYTLEIHQEDNLPRAFETVKDYMTALSRKASRNDADQG